MDWWFLGQNLWYGVRNGMVYIMFAIGLTLLFGVMGIVNMAHGGFYMLGAMFVYTLTSFLGMNFFVSMILSIALVGVTGFVVNRLAIEPLLKLDGAVMNVMLSTIGLGFMLLYGSTAIWGSDIVPIRPPFPFQVTLHLGNITITGAGLVLVFLGVIEIGALHFFLTKTKLGKQTRATSQNPGGASLVGINVSGVHTYTMMGATATAGLAGILVAPIYGAYSSMGEHMLILGFVVVILGGMGNVRGVVITGLGIGLLEAMFGQYVANYYRMVFIYALMIIGLLWRPEGVFVRK